MFEMKGGEIMKKFKLIGLLASVLTLSGCMATLNPDGTISAGYMVPEVNSVVITNRPARPVRLARNPGPRPTHHARPDRPASRDPHSHGKPLR